MSDLLGHIEHVEKLHGTIHMDSPDFYDSLRFVVDAARELAAAKAKVDKLVELVEQAYGEAAHDCDPDGEKALNFHSTAVFDKLTQILTPGGNDDE